MKSRCLARRALTLLTAIALLGVTQRANAEPESTDTGHIRTGWVAAGGATLGVGYLGSVFIASESGSPYSDWGFVPLVGAPIMAQRTQSHCDRRNGGYDDSVNDYCDSVPVLLFVSVLSSVVQITGGTMVAYGLLDRKKEEPKARFAVAPVVVGRAGYGVAASGSF